LIQCTRNLPSLFERIGNRRDFALPLSRVCRAAAYAAITESASDLGAAAEPGHLNVVRRRCGPARKEKEGEV